MVLRKPGGERVFLYMSVYVCVKVISKKKKKKLKLVVKTLVIVWIILRLLGK